MCVVVTHYGSIFAAISVILWQCIDMKLMPRPKGVIVPGPIIRVTPSDTSVARRSCTLTPDPGPCRANIQMFYFEPSNGECDTFQWGGCQGNGNRFDTKTECLNSCTKNASEARRPRWCNLSFDYGFCFGAVVRYYYDHMWKVCKKTIYSGCGGNKNNFYSLEQCESVCRFGKGRLEVVTKTDGRPKKVLIINPESATVKRGLEQIIPAVSIALTT